MSVPSLLHALAARIPAGLYPRLVQRDWVAVFYHAVSDAPMPHVRNLYPIVPEADFEAALRYLKENYTFITYEQLYDHIFNGAALPPRAVHLSFDDGYAECFSVVRPLLKKYEVPCTFFLVTDLLDNQRIFYRNKQSLCMERLRAPDFDPAVLHGLASRFQVPAALSEFTAWFTRLRLPDEAVIDAVCEALGVDWQAFLAERHPYLTREQVRQMQAEGFTIGAHTVTHRKLMDLSPDEIQTEIAASCQIVGEITGQEVVPFSFPHSAWGLDRAHLAEIRARHPFIGLMFDTKGLRQDVPFIANRIWAERRIQGDKLAPLPEIFTLAYQDAWVEAMLAAARNLRSKRP